MIIQKVRQSEDWTVSTIYTTDQGASERKEDFTSYVAAREKFDRLDKLVGKPDPEHADQTVLSVCVTRRSYQVLGETVAIVTTGDRLLV